MLYKYILVNNNYTLINCEFEYMKDKIFTAIILLVFILFIIFFWGTFIKSLYDIEADKKDIEKQKLLELSNEYNDSAFNIK